MILHLQCWVIGHLQLTPEEAERYRGIPVVYHDEIVRSLLLHHSRATIHQYQGFFIEPRVETNIMKICNEFPGYTRYMKTRPFGASEDIEVSVPRSHATHPSDTMPTEGLDDIKRLIRILIPEFVGREIIDQKMCWCTGTCAAWSSKFELTPSRRYRGCSVALLRRPSVERSLPCNR